MKISIENFKAIKFLPGFELKPLTILSGVNSSGKSSLIQLLLLIKQTLQLDSTRNPLFLDGEFYQVAAFEDILTGKKVQNKLKITFEFSKQEDIGLDTGKRIKLFDSYQTFLIKIQVEFDFKDDQIFISEFSVFYELPGGDKKEQFVKFKTSSGKKNRYVIETNNSLFGEELWGQSPQITDIGYSSIFPSYYEILEIQVEEGIRKGQKIIEEQNITKYFPKIDGIKNLLTQKFQSISYIGPLRELPKDLYPKRSNKRHVGNEGEFTAQILENFAKEKLTILKPYFSNDNIRYEEIDTTLLEAVKIWMCDIFKIGKDIYAKSYGDAYTIYLKNEAGIETTIKHVGFGISQVLPIVVEGLLMSVGGTLILEQPEIHLHPMVQSLLFDFLHSLVKQGKNVVIETHSDHFITRMRRRIAESNDDALLDAVNLTFIEGHEGEIYFEEMELDNMGTVEYFPKDFIEQSSLELKAILRAQLNKNTNTK